MSSTPTSVPTADEVRSLCGRAGGLAARCGRDSTRAREARREFRVAALAEDMRRTIAAVGPLTVDQRSKLAVLPQPSAPARPAGVV